MGFKLNWFSLIIDKQKPTQRNDFQEPAKKQPCSWKISQDILPPPDFHNSAICRNSSAIFSARKCGGAQFEKCLLCILHNFAPFLRPIWLEAEIRKAAIMIVPLFSPHSLFYPITCKKKPFCANALRFFAFFVQFFPKQKIRLC